jgi:NADPH-dependent glutamate synthase beta subunit-like oxidoreductase/2,4-dienoyl-CoA reductase-like NADH-dependent reductase (Old Yellow Enzyme family)
MQAAEHEIFHYHSLDELRARIEALGLAHVLELSEDLSPLFTPLRVGALTLPNRFVVLPMEGCDGTPEGAPDELTFRRYRRFAAGGAGLLWFEATAVVREGRANPRQLWLHAGTVDAFARLVDMTLRTAGETMGPQHRPMLVLQLTHSGRYSRPGRKPQPIIAHHSKYLDPAHQLPADYPLISDDELDRLQEAYLEAARLAQKAGFDAVDIKACHRYLVSELLASFTRENSRYGGESLENRSRFLREVVLKIRAAVPGLLVTSRMNAFDAMPHPYGFGMSREHPQQPDLAEPKVLAQFFHEQQAPVLNITVGNPYHNPHVNRPFDLPVMGAPLSPESPLRGVARFVQIVAEMQRHVPELPMIGGGYSWLRQFFPHLAAANVRKGWVALAGMGRLAFAYPNAVRELADHGRLNPEKVCVACSACTQIMRDGGRTGCVPRDAEIYEPIYKAGRMEALDTILQMAETCRQCNAPTCLSGCPARVNIPRFVGLIARRQFREAYEVLREANILAAVCGYVCPAEVLCESRCINQHYTETVPIQHLQRWVSRKALEEGWAAEARPLPAATGFKVLVVGGGPAGIAAAVRLAGLGHRVTILDKEPAPGGALQAVLPPERLPSETIRQEIEAVLTSCAGAIERQQGCLDAEHPLDFWLGQGYHGIILAPGLGQSAPGLKGPRPKSGVEGALEFLARIKQGGRVSGTVLVLGGGNTAMDAAVSALKAGADDVLVIYRRSLQEMPAWPQEREHAIHCGVAILSLTLPLEYVSDDQGRVCGVKVVRTRLGPHDASGRRTPLPIAGTEHILPGNWVVEAFGQRLDSNLRRALAELRFTEQGLIWTQPGSLQTSRPGVFAAGDAVNGGTTVVQAVAEGMKAAMELDAWLRRKDAAQPSPTAG